MLAAVIAVTTALAVVVVPRLSPDPARRPRGTRTTRWLRHPGTWLALVVVCFGVVQVLVVAYMHQAWGDDTTRVTRYLPPGWFDLADLGPLADRLPAWPWTVLHAQAALELPFVLLAYLLVCRWWSADAAARLVRARWLVAAAWTLTFCLVEADLRSPWTTVDIVVRVLSGLVTGLVLPLLDDGARRPPVLRPSGLLRSPLLPFAVSAAALGCLVLAVYDVATLYNSAHLGRWVPVAALAGAVLALARWWAAAAARTVEGLRSSPVLAAAAASLGWFTVLFAAPALPLRYGIGFGAAPVSAVAGLVLVAASVRLGWTGVPLRWSAVVAAAGTVLAVLGAVVAHGYPEARLLAAAAGFVVGGAVAAALVDRRLARLGPCSNSTTCRRRNSGTGSGGATRPPAR